MNKLLKTMMMTLAVTFGVAAAASAQLSHTFDINVELPKATGFEAVMYRIDAANQGDPSGWQVVSGTLMDFGVMASVEDADGNFLFFGPDHFYAVDFFPVGGAGVPGSVSFDYSDTNNPNANAGAPYSTQCENGSDGQCGLGTKATLSAAAARDGLTEILLDSVRLLDASSANYTHEVLEPADGVRFPRIYVGISTGETAGVDVFSPIDHYGVYSGQLTVTMTPPA